MWFCAKCTPAVWGLSCGGEPPAIQGLMVTGFSLVLPLKGKSASSRKGLKGLAGGANPAEAA